MSKEWKLVPVEPTDDMKEAGAPSCEYTGTVCAALCYEAMIAAAPVVEIKPAGWLYTEHSENGHPYKPDFSQSQWVSMPDTYQEQPVYLAPPELAELKAVVEQQKSLIASLRSDLRDSYSIDAAVQEEHLDLEAAAKKLAACMDYPWEHMPEQGRASMREHATAVIGAALSVSAEPADLWSRPEERGCPELEPCSGCGTPGWTAACDKCIPY
jgi:hypothetical protein